MRAKIIILTLGLSSGLAFSAENPTHINKLLEKASGTPIAELLTDQAPGSVSAAAMLGLSGDSVSTIENVRDVVATVKGIGKDTVIGVSITPARSSLGGMSLSTYSGNPVNRILGSLTLGFAQGKATIEDKDYERQAFSAETSFYFQRKDDPLLALTDAIAKEEKDCTAIFVSIEPTTTATADPANGQGVAVVPATNIEASAEAIKDRFEKCRASIDKNLTWNRSKFAVSYATGWIKSIDGSKPEESLGENITASLVFGMGIMPIDKSALYLTYHRLTEEPVLDTLKLAKTELKDSSLTLVQYKYGDNNVRGTIEVSDAKSTDITTSQRAFKKAIGIDYKVYDGVWLNFRFGKQQKTDGSGTEYGSLLDISYSPSALIKL